MTDKTDPDPSEQSVPSLVRIIRENIQSLLRQMPDLAGRDPADAKAAASQPGAAIDLAKACRLTSGWRGIVTEWTISPFAVMQDGQGPVQVLPSLTFLTAGGEVIVVFGWPAIRSWHAIVRHLGEVRCHRGVAVVVKERASLTTGGSYWVVIQDE